MAEYTYKDVIIDPQDERLKGAVGKQVYYDDKPILAVQYANQNVKTGTLIRLNKKGEQFPFCVQRREAEDKFNYVCIIIKKEPEVKYVPFDLSKEEDRDFLRDKWVRHKERHVEFVIREFSSNESGKWNTYCCSAKNLFKNFTFLDGTPVGKKVEE